MLKFILTSPDASFVELGVVQPILSFEEQQTKQKDTLILLHTPRSRLYVSFRVSDNKLLYESRVQGQPMRKHDLFLGMKISSTRKRKTYIEIRMCLNSYSGLEISINAPNKSITP
jgi:hypothetical protein